jgi:ADP-ribose pyrophosphatase YjhB (NUDIX family)
MHLETLLGTIPGATDDARIAVVAVAAAGAAPGLEVREQTDCRELGWVTQRRIALSPSQARALSTMLARAAAEPEPVPRAAENNVVELAAFRRAAG